MSDDAVDYEDFGDGDELPVSPKNVQFQQLREGSNIIRHPHVPQTGVPYTAAQESWNMLNILALTHPGPSTKLMWAVVFCNATARWTGELPQVAQESSPILAKEMGRIEQKLRAAMGVDVRLNEDERNWLRGLRWVELVIWCKDQMSLGNNTVRPTFIEAQAWLAQNPIPVPLSEFIANHQWLRTGGTLP